MARLDEIAEGLAAVLSTSSEPEPLFLDLMNHSPGEATLLIRPVVDACQRRAAPMTSIRLGSELGSHAKRALGPEPLQYEGVRVELTSGLDRRVEFYRFPCSS